MRLLGILPFPVTGIDLKQNFPLSINCQQHSFCISERFPTSPTFANGDASCAIAPSLHHHHKKKKTPCWYYLQKWDLWRIHRFSTLCCSVSQPLTPFSRSDPGAAVVAAWCSNPSQHWKRSLKCVGKPKQETCQKWPPLRTSDKVNLEAFPKRSAEAKWKQRGLGEQRRDAGGLANRKQIAKREYLYCSCAQRES